MKIIILAIAVVLVGSACFGATYYVSPDGTGDFLNVAAGILVAAPGDSLIVKDGVYVDPLLIEKDLTLVSENGAPSTILDGEDFHGIMTISGTVNVRISGFTFLRGAIEGDTGFGAGILAWNSASVSIEECIFDSNRVGNSHGGVHVRHSGTSVIVNDCSFLNNISSYGAAGCGAYYGGDLSVSNSIFSNNFGHGMASCCDNYEGNLVLINNLFFNNAGYGDTIYLRHGPAHISGNTFFRNDSRAATLRVSVDYHTVIVFNNIFAGDLTGYGLQIGTSDLLQHHDNVLWGNAMGSNPWGYPLDPSEFEADPLFCAPEAADFQLCSDSPCAPANSAVGLIGALGVGCGDCGPVPVEAKSFGEVKALFR